MLTEIPYSIRPDRIVMKIEKGYGVEVSEGLAQLAVTRAKQTFPKITGHLSSTLSPVFGEEFWGIYFPDKRVWFLEQGTNPFTMNRLAGKTIHMWVDDPDGELSRENKKAKTRMTIDGRRQILIFRRAAAKGERKMVRRRGRMISVPKSYPGAPGRISNRSSGGRIGTPNGGVRWRHPGIEGRAYLNQAMEQAAYEFGIEPTYLYLTDSATFATVTRD